MTEAIFNRANLILLAVTVLCFTMASCATPAETAAVTTAIIGAAGAFVHELQPLLSPEMQAKLATTATTIDGTVSATAQAVGIIADAIAQFKASVATQSATFADGIGAAKEQLAAMPSREEVYLVGSGSAAGGTVVSRVLSRIKHSTKAAA